VLRALPLIEASSAEYRRQRQCFSCHHQALPILTAIEAQLHGFAINEDNFKAQLEHTAAHLRRGRSAYAEGRGQGGQVDTAGWALWSLARGEQAGDETSEAIVNYLIKTQHDHGYWEPTGRGRRPTQGSDFTTTFLALYGIAEFATADQASAADQRLQRVKAWLNETEVADTEDRVFQLRALDQVGADRDVMQSAAGELLQLQREDGGWSQEDGLESDAYATGTVLTALHDTNSLDAEHAAYARGVAYLLTTQRSDGSWKVATRATPIQTYFESGFPYEKDQFISMAASCWATMALLKACPQERTATTKNQF
jgi:N-acyl-D-amino-acid deacylase